MLLITTFMAESRKAMRFSVNIKYYSKTDTSPFYATVLILYPSRHTEYIKVN